MQTLNSKVEEVDVKQDGSTYVKLSMLDNIISTVEDQSYIENKPSAHPTSVNVKIIKASQDSLSAVKTTESYSAIIGSPFHRIISSKDHGNFLVGPTTFTANPENIRIGGVFRLNGLMTSTMPSTIISPIPAMVFDFPMKANIESYGKILSDYTEFIASII